jgi:hypothetical protein
MFFVEAAGSPYLKMINRTNITLMGYIVLIAIPH